MHSYFFSNKHCARILHGCLSDFLERNAFYICESFSDMSNIHRKIALSAMRYWRKIRSVSFKSKTIKRGHFYRFDQWIVIFAECDNAGKGQKKSKLEKLFSHLRRSDVAVNNPAQFSLILLEDCIKIFVGIPTVYHKRFLCFKRNIRLPPRLHDVAPCPHGSCQAQAAAASHRRDQLDLTWPKPRNAG